MLNRPEEGGGGGADEAIGGGGGGAVVAGVAGATALLVEAGVLADTEELVIG
ncbi:hypothetical protein D3C80_1754620 [compost metagenome]